MQIESDRPAIQQKMRTEDPFVDSSRKIQERPVTRRAFGISALTMAVIAMTPTELFSQEKDNTFLRSKELFNSNNTNVQMHLFYDDRIDDWDGHKSFGHMLMTYGFKINWNKNGDIDPIKTTQNKDWQIEDKGSYINIISIGKPKKIEIYANKPDHSRDGPEEIAKVFSLQRILPHVVVHRGHNIHVHQTVLRIPPSVKLFINGACEGNMDVGRIIRRAPNAQIIAAEGTGTMVVTDHLIKMLNEEILSGRDLNWPIFWEKAGKELGGYKDFHGYIPPYKIRP